MLTTIQASDKTSSEVAQRGEWSVELDAIRSLNRIDVALVTASHRDSNERLLELRRAMAVVQSQLDSAEQTEAAIDLQIREVVRLVAMLKSAAEHDSNFQSIHGSDVAKVIDHVRPLKSFAE